MKSSDPEAFWERVDRSGGPEACWPFIGARTPPGYGVVSWRTPEGKKNQYAHRISFLLTHGFLPAPPLLIRHSCDNPSCCQPNHLLPGSKGDNIADAYSRGRRPPGNCGVFGERVGRSVLTAETVNAIRRRYEMGETMSALAREHKVCRQHIRGVVRGLSWKHLLEAA